MVLKSLEPLDYIMQQHLTNNGSSNSSVASMQASNPSFLANISNGIAATKGQCIHRFEENCPLCASIAGGIPNSVLVSSGGKSMHLFENCSSFAKGQKLALRTSKNTHPLEKKSKILLGDSKDLCKTCESKFYNEKEGMISAVSEGEEYRGVIRDGFWQAIWKCGETHSTFEEARTCAKRHYNIHKSGKCFCIYLTPPQPPNLLDHDKLAQLYILKNDKLKAWKIGVTGNLKEDRLKQHYIYGWEMVVRWKGLYGDHAYKQEQRIIRRWRENGFKHAVHYSKMPQGGATETASFDDVSSEDIESIIKEINIKINQQPIRS